jgi:hypothetical protein
MSTSRIDQLNCLVFPKIYGRGSKSDAIAQELFSMMVKYAEDKD